MTASVEQSRSPKCQRDVGLEMGTASSNYIQLYHGNASLLAESLEVVQSTASTILRALVVDEMAGMSVADAEVA